MRIEPFKPAFQLLIDQYQLSEEQLRYTGTPDFPIKIAENFSFIHPLLGIENDKLTTFFVIDEKKDVHLYTKNTHAVLLRTFSTDQRLQGQGYAKKVLLLLPEYIKSQFPSVTEIVLAVNEENIAPQKLYEKTGFSDTSMRVVSDTGLLKVMHLML